ncbi:RICIN domain-containing protein [Natrinema sp. H-ect4]|uniref:RICIN domain-containing protein n=1 Tax=Natrinema sp. H-ect4 TaxID=3242699 RepID=UPI0035A8435A
MSDKHTPDESYSIDRRTLLKTTATAAVAAVGVGATTGSAAADTDSIMEVDLRGGIPPVTDAPQGEDEVIFNVHGYTGSSASVSQSQTLQDTLRQLGNTETVTAVTWDDSGLPSSAESSARQQGADFADWMEGYIQANPGTTIRILGHSMGGIVTFEFLAAAEGRFRVANADTIGSYEVTDAPCEGSAYHTAIENVANFSGNYYSTNDSIARLGSGPADCGFGGGSLPSNYADVDVSGSVGSHTTYKASTGFGQAYLSNFAPAVDRGGSGGSGAEISEGTYRLTNVNSGKLLEVANAETSDGANVQQYGDTGHPTQEWVVSDNGDGTYTFENANSGKFLEVANAETTDGANVQQYSDTGHATQDWIVLDNGDGTYTLENANSGKVADVYESSTADGANVVQWSSNGGPQQRWTLEQI